MTENSIKMPTYINTDGHDSISANLHKHSATYLKFKTQGGCSATMLEYLGCQSAFYGAILTGQPKILLVRIASAMKKALEKALEEEPEHKDKIQILLENITKNNAFYVRNYGS
jgi:hypothetical protein